MYCTPEVYYQINICIIVGRKYIFRKVCVRLCAGNVLSDICIYVQLLAGNLLSVTCVYKCMQEIHYQMNARTMFSL